MALARVRLALGNSALACDDMAGSAAGWAGWSVPVVRGPDGRRPGAEVEPAAGRQ